MCPTSGGEGKSVGLFYLAFSPNFLGKNKVEEITSMEFRWFRFSLRPEVDMKSCNLTCSWNTNHMGPSGVIQFLNSGGTLCPRNLEVCCMR